MEKNQLFLKKIKKDELSESKKEYFFNGTLSSSNGEKIFLNNTSIILEYEDYLNLKNSQEIFISFEDILKIFHSVYIIKEPNIPFPQADIFEIFIAICERLYQHKSLSREQIMTLFEINPRQYSFYISAGEYLRLIDVNKSKYKCLNQIGLGVFSLNIKERNLALVKLIFQHKPFHDVFGFYLENERIPTSDEIFDILKRNKIYNINSDVTLKRRATSVRSWIKWIVNLYDD